MTKKEIHSRFRLALSKTWIRDKINSFQKGLKGNKGLGGVDHLANKVQLFGFVECVGTNKFMDILIGVL